MESCEKIQARDPQPLNRDEKRAFYDAIRDIEAARNGYTLIRVRHGDIDWFSADADKYIDQLFQPQLCAQNHTNHFTSFQLSTDELPSIFNWRTLEIEFQRLRLNYIKWLFYLTPPKHEVIPGYRSGEEFILFFSDYGRSFSCSPAGIGSVYAGGGKGCVRITEECFLQVEPLKKETVAIKASLTSLVAQLKEKVSTLIDQKQYSLSWAAIQNYW